MSNLSGIASLSVGNTASTLPLLVQLNNNSNALSVNSNACVGIGKSNAAYPLDVVGSINFTGSLNQNGAPYIGSQFTVASASNVYLPAGSNLAIGKSNPTAALDVAGNVNISGSLTIGGSNMVAASSYQISYVFQAANDTTGPAFVGATGTTSVLKYTDTYNNAATALNTSTATFTAPVSGIYMVSAYNIENKSASAPATIQVSVNGSTTDTTYTINIENDSVGNASSASYPISLTAGNTVQFYVSSGAVFGSTGAGGIASKGRYSIALMNQNASLSIGQATGMGVPNQVVFTSGTAQSWTVPSGVTAVQVEMVGGGGAGGTGTNTSPYGGGGGGGAGGYFRLVLNSTLASSLSYSVGAAGNNTTVTYNGYTYTATAGGAGGNNNGNGTYPGVGGSGGVPSYSANTACLSALVVNGGDGNAGGNLVSGTSSVYGGTGGASYFGNGSKGGPTTPAAVNATVYGSGGGGGGNSGGAPGAGAPGVVIITYFTQSGLPTNYTASAPLSMSGTTLSIAAATSNAPGVVQVGSGLSVSSGVISATQALKAYGVFTTTTVATGSHPSTIGVWTAANSVTPIGIAVGTSANKQNQFSLTNAGTYFMTATYQGYNTGTSANSIKLYLYASGATIGTTAPLQQTPVSYESSTGGYLCNTATVTTMFTVASTDFVLASIELDNAQSSMGISGSITIMQIA